MNERAIFPSISISLFCSHLVALLMKCLAIVFLSSWNCEWKLKNKSQQFFDNLFFQMPGSSLFCGCKAKANEFTCPCIFWIHGNWVGENEKKNTQRNCFLYFCFFLFVSNKFKNLPNKTVNLKTINLCDSINLNWFQEGGLYILKKV